MVGNKAKEAIEISKQNRDKKENLKIKLAEEDPKVADEDSEIQLLEDINYLKNWSVRKTLIIKNRTIQNKKQGKP